MRRLTRKLALLRRRWRRDEDGATAVEFAIIAMVFFWLFIGIVEIGMMMIFNSGLEDGVARAGRMIRTGQVQNGGLSAAQFRDKICDQVVLKTSCKSRLIVDVQKFPDFAHIGTLTEPTLDKTGKLTAPSNFVPGSAKQVVVVRAFYDWKFFTPLIGQLMSNIGGNRFLLSVATTFRNEPYGG